MDSLQVVPNHAKASEADVCNRPKASKDEFWPLSEKPWFNVILNHTHMRPTFTLHVPTEEFEFAVPQSSSVDAILTYGGKEWKTVARREGLSSRTSIKWREFVVDNLLKEGDACVFELTENSKTLKKLRVQILRGDFPSQLLKGIDGVTPDKPIIL